MCFGSRLREERERQQLSLGELARRAEVNKGYLWTLEQGPQSNPSIQIARRLAAALEVDLGYLVTGAPGDAAPDAEELPGALCAFIAQREESGAPLSPGQIEDLAKIQLRGQPPNSAEQYASLLAQLEIFTREEG